MTSSLNEGDRDNKGHCRVGLSIFLSPQFAQTVTVCRPLSHALYRSPFYPLIFPHVLFYRPCVNSWCRVSASIPAIRRFRFVLYRFSIKISLSLPEHDQTTGRKQPAGPVAICFMFNCGQESFNLIYFFASLADRTRSCASWCG